MEKVESVDVDQSILGRLLGYGDVTVRGTGEGIEPLRKSPRLSSCGTRCWCGSLAQADPGQPSPREAIVELEREINDSPIPQSGLANLLWLQRRPLGVALSFCSSSRPTSFTSEQWVWCSR